MTGTLDNLQDLTSNIFTRFCEVDLTKNDPTDKKQLGYDKLSELILQNEMLISIIEKIPMGIQIVNKDGIITYVNPAFLDILGIKSSDRIGKSIFEVSPDGSLAAVLNTRSSVSNRINNPEGTKVELVSSASPLYYKDDMIGAVATMRDIRDIVSLSKDLKQSRHMTENLLEKISYLSQAKYFFADIIGDSPNMRRIIELSKDAAYNDSIVLIQGETGTGKELIASAIHNESMRSLEPFICINCSAVPENLLESEFFGHEKGAFSGAIKRKIGKFELANKGTLFLDEIGEMPLSLQPKILRAIQEKNIQRVGGEKEIDLDIRIIAATNRDLKRMVKNDEFRSDLYYRLNVIKIEIPPLRKRKEDLSKLVRHLTNKICKRLGRKIVTFNEEAMEIICRYNWPGNVRELENVIERAIVGSKTNVIDAGDLSHLMLDNNTNKDS